MLGLYGFYGLATLYTIAAAVVCVRRGHGSSWLWIVLLFGPVGATVYLVSQFEHLVRPRVMVAPRASVAVLRRARLDAARLDTAAAWAECATLHGDRGRWAEAAEAARRGTSRFARDREREGGWTSLELTSGGIHEVLRVPVAGQASTWSHAQAFFLWRRRGESKARATPAGVVAGKTSGSSVPLPAQP